MYYSIYPNRICDFIIVGDEKGISQLMFYGEDKVKQLEADGVMEDSIGFQDVISQLDDFFTGRRSSFDLRLNPKGTPFQKQVWQELMHIPYGETRTYKEIATAVGNPKASRAVGMANNKNPIPLIIPCHRVIGSSGKLVGYAGGLDVKTKLIGLEKMHNLYNKLQEAYGNTKWWPASSVYEMMVGAILTQNTNWKNVEKAIEALGEDLQPEIIADMDLDTLANKIRSSGYYNQKAKKVKYLTAWFKQYDYDIEQAKKYEGDKLREELLSLHGIGKETADCILTYALDKPHFIIDTYTRRLFSRLGLDVPKEYDDFRGVIENGLYPDLHMFREYHGLIVTQCVKHCTKVPNCTNCPLSSMCKTYQ